MLRLFLAVAIALSSVVFLGGWSSGYADDAKQIMREMRVNAELTQNGDMTIQETWVVDLQNRDKPYRNLYRTFTKDSSKAGEIKDLSVYDEDQGVQYSFKGDVDPTADDSSSFQDVCYIHNSGNETELGWFMPGIKSGTRTFRVSYTICNVVHLYSDTAELYYKFLPDQFGLPVTKLTGTLTFPDGAEKKDLLAWLHTTASKGSNISIDSGKQISFTAVNIPKETFVETRLLMPTKLFPSSTRKSSESILSSVKAEEMKEAKQQLEKDLAAQRLQHVLGIIDAVVAPIILIVCILLLILQKRKQRRIRVEAPEYTRDIPKGNSPAGIANLFYYYDGIADKEKERMYSSTFLSLAQKGYIRFAGDRKEIEIHLIGDTKNIPLTESEHCFYEIISTVSEAYNGTFTMKQFKEYSKVHFKYIDTGLSGFFTSAKREISQRGYYGPKTKGGAFIAVGVLMAVFAFIVLFATGSQNFLMVYIPLAMLVGGILLIIAGTGKRKLSQKGEYELATWQGLKKYMLEFSRMKEYGIPELPLWEEYLVYASMMGISKQVCKQLKLVYPQVNEESYWNSDGGYLPYVFWRYNRFGNGIYSNEFDLGASLGHAMSDISEAATRLAHPVESSSGSFGGSGGGGGGFSGGGGGFGGGGGGVR